MAATPPEIKAELGNAVRALERAVVAWNFDAASQIHGHIQDLLEDLHEALTGQP